MRSQGGAERATLGACRSSWRRDAPRGVTRRFACAWHAGRMTIAVAVKVNDGFVLAADSATTLSAEGVDGTPQVVNIYNNANKIFNLHKGLPIGALTWGRGSIGPSSIATLAKDLRVRFTGADTARPEWRLDPDAYQMAEVAERAREFLEDEKFASLGLADGTNLGDLGLLIGGYSAGADEPELYELAFGATPAVVPVLVGSAGVTWHGQPEAITRMLLGVSNAPPQALVNLGVAPADVSAYRDAIQQQIAIPFVADAMPIQDAIDFANFLVHMTIQFVRFSPGSPTVGGPIEVASITKHEGFRWVARKHYFNSHLNSPMEMT